AELMKEGGGKLRRQKKRVGRSLSQKTITRGDITNSDGAGELGTVVPESPEGLNLEVVTTTMHPVPPSGI
ncbi:hypothetical protein A2U01_0114020, partial [Trifolium medium]|nr:hypothetical protein [Trifolium medium]